MADVTYRFAGIPDGVEASVAAASDPGTEVTTVTGTQAGYADTDLPVGDYVATFRSGGYEHQVAGDLAEPTDVDYARSSTGGGSGASGQAGSPIVRAFPFAYDTAGLTTGVEIWTPAPGDILFDVWFEVDTAWNGTTPLADVGQFLNGETGGLFSYNLGAVDLTFADRQYLLPTGLLSENGAVSGTKPTDLAGSAIAGDLPTVRRWLPAKFLTDDPVKIVVSTTGANDGDDPGATQGAGVLYLHTVTPVTA